MQVGAGWTCWGQWVRSAAGTSVPWRAASSSSRSARTSARASAAGVPAAGSSPSTGSRTRRRQCEGRGANAVAVFCGSVVRLSGIGRAGPASLRRSGQASTPYLQFPPRTLSRRGWAFPPPPPDRVGPATAALPLTPSRLVISPRPPCRELRSAGGRRGPGRGGTPGLRRRHLPLRSLVLESVALADSRRALALHRTSSADCSAGVLTKCMVPLLGRSGPEGAGGSGGTSGCATDTAGA